MATFRDPNQCFAPLEVIERMLEIREDFGFAPVLYLPHVENLTDFLDSYGFDIYAFKYPHGKLDFGDYRTPVVPGGDALHLNITTH